MAFFIQLARVFFITVCLEQSTAPPPPPPADKTDSPFIISNPYNSFCPGEELGFLNDSCNDTHPCVNDYSIQCINGVCSCLHDYFPSSLHNGLCDPVPNLNQPCDSVCRVPLVCTDHVPSTTPYPTPYYEASTSPAQAETDAPPSPSTSAYVTDTEEPISTTSAPRRKTCQCLPPYYLQYVYTRTTNCVLNCESDEYYDENDGKCKPRCEVAQVKLANGDCAPVAKLGESCYDGLQCTQERSICTDGVCACEPGFTSEKEHDKEKGKGNKKKTTDEETQCVPEEYSCPWSEPLKEKGKVIECNLTHVSYPAYRMKTSCPSDAYCLTTSPSAYYSNYVLYGFCCPKPKLTCPVGKPLQSAKCPNGPSYPPSNVCPSQTHYCYTVTVGQDAYSESLCCPLTCDRNFVLVDGECYPQVRDGDQCETDAQCPFNTACVNGTCSCPPGSYGGPYCSFSCQYDEVLINNKCYKRRKLGEYCGDAPGNVCPINAGCDPDEANTCQCYCNSIPIGNTRCEHYPVCRRSRNDPYYAQYSQYSTTPSPNCTVGGSCTTQAPTPTPPPQPPAPGNFTFCAVNGVEPPVAVAEECPEGKFCNSYLGDLGLCCPIPEPICPNGARSTQSCDQSIYYSCPSNQICHQYYGSVGDEPAAGYICCEDQYIYNGPYVKGG